MPLTGSTAPLGRLDARDRHSFLQRGQSRAGSRKPEPRYAPNALQRKASASSMALTDCLPAETQVLPSRRLVVGCGTWVPACRYSPLRPSTDLQVCGKPTRTSTTLPHSILEAESRPAPEGRAFDATIHRRCAGRAPTELMGQMVALQIYLAELRNTATLLLHLLTRPGGRTRVHWGICLHTEASARQPNCCGPRWESVHPLVRSIRPAPSVAKKYPLVARWRYPVLAG